MLPKGSPLSQVGLQRAALFQLPNLSILGEENLELSIRQR